jgi:hypothetical protein
VNEPGPEPFVDEAGDQVLRFVSAARNLSRLGELTDEVAAIAKSGAWRRYKTALGTDEWRECELDYFLIACDLSHEDISRIATYTREGATLASMMDRNADLDRRRTLEEAAAAWHSPAGETLTDRARRLGWTRSGTSSALRAAPVPPRARARQAYGMTKDEHAQRGRAEKLDLARKAELDEAVNHLRSLIKNEGERLYVIDQLRGNRPHGRPSVSDQDRQQWHADAARLNWDAARLAAEWGIAARSARRRLRGLRQDASELYVSHPPRPQSQPGGCKACSALRPREAS